MALSLKAGPRRAVLHPALAMSVMVQIVRDCYQDLGQDCVINSGTDFHTTGLHPKGKALDFATKLVGDTIFKRRLVDMVRARVGPDFDVILEDLRGPNEHMHVEYDPQHNGTGEPAPVSAEPTPGPQ